MAEVRVFVDDAVQGVLPRICAKSGMPTTDRLVVRQPATTWAGGTIAFLLFGPLVYWLIAAALARSAGMLTVELPLSASAYERLQSSRRFAHRALIAAVACMAGAIIAVPSALVGGIDNLGMRALAIVASVGFVTAMIYRLIANLEVRDRSVEIELDASRRWVTLTRVHPAFVAACEAHEQRQPQRT